MKKVHSLLVLLLLAVPAFAGTVNLPFANFEGYDTTLVVVNPTAEAQPVAVFGPRWPSVRVEAAAVERIADWPGIGGGVASLEVPDGLAAYVEVRDPNNARVRIGDVGGERATARLFDLLIDDGFASYVFIYSPSGGTVDVTQTHGDVALVMQLDFEPGETKIVKASAASVALAADTTWSRYVGEGRFIAFALLSRQPGGEMLSAPAY